MNTSSDVTLLRRHQKLRQQLMAQRLLIVQQLDPVSGGDSRSDFPRSLTMRFVSQRPALATKLLTECAGMLLGAGLSRSMITRSVTKKSVTMAVILAGVVCATAIIGKRLAEIKTPPAPEPPAQ